jgi:1L-myo-inositol 1-phosphate cytidylyltransferase
MAGRRAIDGTRLVHALQKGKLVIETAVILAAGRGSRLDPGSDETFSKPLVRVGGKSLLERTVDACRNAGARRIIVVTGFRTDLIEAEVARLNKGDLETVFNHEWILANGVSLLACRDVIDRDFAMFMSDHLFDPLMMVELMAATPPADSIILAVDYKIASVSELHEANKVRVQDGRLVAIGQDLADYHCIDTGMFACTTAMFDALASVKEERGDCSITDGVRVMSSRGKCHTLDVGAGQWININTEVNLSRALQLIG